MKNTDFILSNEVRDKINSRKDLLELNDDSIYGVYNLKSINENWYELEFLENVMTCYPNQYEDLIWKDSIDSNITILNIWALREWKIEVLHWDKNIKIDNPKLLSNWVVEYIESENNEWIVRKHIQLNKRDLWATDAQQRTTIAWRNSSDDLYEDLELEHTWESPFLWKNKYWEYILSVADVSDEKIKYLENGIKFFLKNKYLIKWLKDNTINISWLKKEYNTLINTKLENNTNNNILIEINLLLEKDDMKKISVIRMFERSFPWIRYEDLWNILEGVVENKRYLQYETKNWKIEWLDKDIKTIKLWNSKWDFLVLNDKDSNTIEYRKILQITRMSDDFVSISKRPWRLFLESENQYSRIPRISNANNISKLVPLVKFLCEKSLED